MKDLSELSTDTDLQSQIPSLLYIGKGMRVCDLKMSLTERYSEADIERAAEANVRAGRAKRYEHGGQTFYMLTA